MILLRKDIGLELQCTSMTSIARWLWLYRRK